MDQSKKNVSASTCEPVPYTIRLARRMNQHDPKRSPKPPAPPSAVQGCRGASPLKDRGGGKGSRGHPPLCPVCSARIHATKNRLASGLPEELKDKTLNNFTYTEPWQRQALEAAVSFAKNPDGLLFLGGQSGCGKSHLAAGIIYYVARSGSQPPLYYSWPELLAAVRRTSRNWKADDIRDTLKDCRAVVVLDDFLAAPNGHPATAALETAFEIVSARTANHRPTVIVSPYAAEKIKALYSVLYKKIERAAGDRLISIDPDEGKDFTIKRALA